MSTPSPAASILGYQKDTTANAYAPAGSMAPLAGSSPPMLMMVTAAPKPALPKKTMSMLEIMLIAVAVAIGVITLCLLISSSKSR